MREGLDMAIIRQQTLFNWENDIENLGDLERLQLVIDYMPDDELINALEKDRKNGRNDYPIIAMWNAILAGVVFQHISIESLRRELSRNGQLRYMCGFGIIYTSPQRKNFKTKKKKAELVPPAYVFTRFLKQLMTHSDKIESIFEKFVKFLSTAPQKFVTS